MDPRRQRWPEWPYSSTYRGASREGGVVGRKELGAHNTEHTVDQIVKVDSPPGWREDFRTEVQHHDSRCCESDDGRCASGRPDTRLQNEHIRGAGLKTGGTRLRIILDAGYSLWIISAPLRWRLLLRPQCDGGAGDHDKADQELFPGIHTPLLSV